MQVNENSKIPDNTPGHEVSAPPARGSFWWNDPLSAALDIRPARAGVVSVMDLVTGWVRPDHPADQHYVRRGRPGP
ncbi:hypothetical protein [Streptomyces clavuligerus]|uniref:Uncharacterized protein n=1 Tax=Streptomyces clavuligerus TaxID=1901 RepID=B5GUM4_STRCL|nr:hypothetical protein [Streptomyces clavuligerus]EDY50020.1 hypothetical protein SSCG_03274 [Streptomyces clavuligerus]EFG03727.1 Hypothetical protein SCLAV_p0236 [Streptomyces clavuligerus]QCS09721.1 hypothetical protein CRV15_29290 [Streptomyces clavuligerus]QPJ98234.1 hypothetical protein GE265_35100 [Streptomyces clavuligerus]